jgi:hypothetical protein
VTGDEPVAAVAVRRDEQRLEHPVLPDRRREPVERSPLELAARVELLLDLDVGD